MQLREPVRLVVTSRPGVACDSVLQGPVYRLDLLTAEETERFIAFLGAPIRSLAEILRTPLDLPGRSGADLPLRSKMCGQTRLGCLDRRKELRY